MLQGVEKDWTRVVRENWGGGGGGRHVLVVSDFFEEKNWKNQRCACMGGDGQMHSAGRKENTTLFK